MSPPARRIYGEHPCVVGCARPAEASGLCKTCSGDRVKALLSVEEFLHRSEAPRGVREGPGAGLPADGSAEGHPAMSLRNINQRLTVENSRLLQATAQMHEG